MGLEFKEWINAVGLVKMEIIIRDNSTISIESALNIVRRRTNESANLPAFSEVDVKASISDYRNGNIYEVFSDKWMSKYKQTSWYNLQLDSVAINELLNRDFGTGKGVLRGKADSLRISSEDGIAIIDFENTEGKDYEIFTMHNETIQVDDQIIIKSLTRFEIHLYDFTTFDKKRLNCKESPIDFSYVIIFK